MHADDPRGAIDQITTLALLGGLSLERNAIRRYALGVIDYAVQLQRGEDGRRFISQIAPASDL